MSRGVDPGTGLGFGGFRLGSIWEEGLEEGLFPENQGGGQEGGHAPEDLSAVFGLHFGAP